MNPPARHAPAILLASFLLMLTFLVTTGAAQAARPKIGLRVSTHSGRVPLELELRGTLSGIELDGVSSCRVRVDRTYRTPGGETLVERRDVPCSDPPDAALTLDFRRMLMLEQPGDYALRVILTPASGREMAGTVQDVKVYHSVEVGGKGTRSRH